MVKEVYSCLAAATMPPLRRFKTKTSTNGELCTTPRRKEVPHRSKQLMHESHATIIHASMHKSTTPNNNVFLQGGSSAPVYCPRSHPLKTGKLLLRVTRKKLLSLAGDVESNPGPPIICDSCGATIKTNQLQKAVHCNQEHCDARTHKLCKASGISRYSHSPTWTCRHHRGETPIDGTDLTPEPATNAKVRCLNPSCKRIIARPSAGQSWLRCKQCGRCCHKKPECCRMSRDERSHKETSWTCFLCQETGEQDSHLNPDIPIKESAKGMRTVTRSSLRILQWNADGLKSKSDELASRLKSGDIDVAVIQETWLTKSDGTPNVGSEYIAIREDRKVNIQRGGLIIYVRKSVIYDRLGYISKRGTEILSVRVRLTKSKWITLTNYYIPPPASHRGHRPVPPISPAVSSLIQLKLKPASAQTIYYICKFYDSRPDGS